MRRVFSFPGFLIIFTLVMLCTACPPLGTQSENLNRVQKVPQRLTVIGYKRELFGDSWSTNPITGCTTREEIIKTQLKAEKPYSGCEVAAAGQCPYSGKQIASQSDNPDYADVDIDHLFPLAAAWDLGAFSWTEEQRVIFANDPANLVAVSKQENRRKSDSLPSDWLPSKRSNRCWYVNQIADIAVKYDLSLPVADIAVMQKQCFFR